MSIASTSAAGTSDEAHGVDLDTDGSVVLAGRLGTRALLARHDGAGAFVTGATFGPDGRRSLDVSLAADRTIAVAGEENGDATLSFSPVDLQTEPTRHVIAGAGADRANGICHDPMNRVYM